MIIIIFKINKDFGENLYNSVSNTLFYVAFICLACCFICNCIKIFAFEKPKGKDIVSIIAQIVVSSFVLYAVYNPDMLLLMGDAVFQFCLNILKGLEG